MPRGIKGSGPNGAMAGAHAPTVAPADAAATTNIPGGRPMGWLAWWTIHQANSYELAGLRTAAVDAGVPAWMVDRIKGRDEKSAWTVATQVGARGLQSRVMHDDPIGSRSKYLTRDVDDGVRVLMRETIDADNNVVKSVQVATVLYESHDVVMQIETFVVNGVRAELQALHDQMRQTKAALQGNMDDPKIRALVLDWLESRYRICLRGTGGLYFIPRPKNAPLAERIEAEMLAVRKWVTDAPVAGSFSVVAVSDGGGTTVEEFISSAVADLRAELTEVNDRLTSYEQNAKMNAGSVMFSADALTGRLTEISKKAMYLSQSLGDELEVVQIMFAAVEQRARAMAVGAKDAVEAAKVAKAAIKNTQTLAKEPATNGAGKAGTAKERAAVKKL